MESNNNAAKLRKSLTILGVIGAPFFMALIFGCLAYFGNNAVFDFLENETVALCIFVIGVFGTAAEMITAVYLSFRFRGVAVPQE
ncbi:hypothetical protein [Pseudoalteromonas sp. T1lg48]|uniref:hypothetical protein n=1 Tax=Pseudoalteromonas sp. T1lg48 TaxID=2077100 RepID=UPI000CF6B107|nr:hypothetical protein [Pseudoalteromonas sp. T1lg48]